MYHSRVFMTRLALKPTMVIADNGLVGEFLNNCMDNFYNGLKDQYSELFGHNIMFADPDEAKTLRNVCGVKYRCHILQNTRTTTISMDNN